MKEQRENEKRSGVEIEVLRRLGMKWAVLIALYHVLSKNGTDLPQSVIEELRFTRSLIGSGCFKVCDVNCALDHVERVLIQRAASTRKGFENFDRWLNLIGKAMKGQLTHQEVMGVPFVKSIIQTCEFLKCSCGE